MIGLDISAEMLAAAAAESDQEGAAPVRWMTADVVTWQPDAGAFDVVLSRFGVMFFSDPAAAFGRLATATRPGGRLAMAVWGRRDESDLFAVPVHAALGELRRRGVQVEAPPDDEGPFSLHDPATVGALLAETGWSDIACTPHELVLPLAGGLDPASAAIAVYDSGPTRQITAELGEDDQAAVTAAIATALGKHLGPDGHVHLNARILVVTAIRP